MGHFFVVFQYKFNLREIMLQRWVLSIAVFMAFLPAVSYAAIPSTNYVNNADHLGRGTVKTPLINVYDKYDVRDGVKTEIGETVASGNDARFDTIQIGKAPEVSGAPGDSTDRAVIWIE